MILKAARAQDEARAQARTGDLDGAKRLLREAAQDLRRAATASSRSSDLEDQAAEMEQHAQTFDVDGLMNPMQSKRMHYQTHQRKRRRDTE